MHHAIGTFNSKAPPIFLKNLVRGQQNVAREDVGKTLDTMPFVTSFAVFTDNVDRKGLFTIGLTGAGIAGTRRATPRQQSTRTAFLATNSQRNNRGKGLSVQEGDDGIVIKASVQVQALNVQTECCGACQEPLQHTQAGITPLDQRERQRIAFAP